MASVEREFEVGGNRTIHRSGAGRDRGAIVAEHVVPREGLRSRYLCECNGADVCRCGAGQHRSAASRSKSRPDDCATLRMKDEFIEHKKETWRFHVSL